MNACDPIDVTLGANLRARRTARRMSLEELGRRIGVTYQQIQKYETGKNRIAAATLIRIAGVLECSPTDLMIGALPDAPREAVTAPSVRALRLAGKIDRLSPENREKFAGLIEAVADANDRDVQGTTPSQPAAAPLAH